MVNTDNGMIERSMSLPILKVAVAHPCDESSLRGAVLAAERGLIAPLLFGPAAKIECVAKLYNINLDPYDIIDTEHSHDSAEMAVDAVRSGRCAALMKGSLHTDELISAVLHKDRGIRTDRRLSHIFHFDVPAYPKPLLITDAAINVEPTLEEKVFILMNAIELAHAIGIPNPKVAILAAVETVNPKMRTTVEAAALCKMVDRKQITGAIVDGPLAFDNAISKEAATIKGIESPVAGDPDILMVPDLESGNMLAKQLTFLAHAKSSGIVLGARAPIILTSRADDAQSRLASCAIASLYAQYLLSHPKAISYS
jgi:phosphotransacetylase